MPEDPAGVAVIGLGFMGRTHVACALAAKGACELVALCDPSDRDATRAKLPIEAIGVPLTNDVRDVLVNPRVELVIIASPTPTHVPLAVAALQAGKHVLVEKPVSLDANRLAELDATAHATGKLCIPAMCMRHWPAWVWLRDRIRDCALGPLRSLTLERLGAQPAWGDGFYSDVAQSGGAAHDLHTHDVDFLLWTLGMPRRVHSQGDVQQQHITTQYDFGIDATVSATASWLLAPRAGFRMRYLALFDGATAEFTLGAPVDEGRDGVPGATARSVASATGTLRCWRHAEASDASPAALGVHEWSAYELQLRAVLDAVGAARSKNALTPAGLALPTILDAASALRTIIAELASVRTRRGVDIT